MILGRLQQEELLEAARPLIKFLNDNFHPHVSVIVDCGSANLSEGVARVVADEYIKD